MTNNNDKSELLPQALQDGIRPSDWHQRAGEWEIEIPNSDLLCGFPQSTDWILVLVSHFRECFDWLEFENARLVYENGEACEWVATDGEVEKWLKDSGREGKICNGLEATLALKSYWSQDTNTELATFLIPGAGQLLIERIGMLKATTNLSIFVNVFSNPILLFEKTVAGLSARPYDFAAAHANRSMISRSLNRWERILGGVINMWESDLVEGVEKYGFADKAKPIL